MGWGTGALRMHLTSDWWGGNCRAAVGEAMTNNMLAKIFTND
jgi:hypothetical protein